AVFMSSDLVAQLYVEFDRSPIVLPPVAASVRECPDQLRRDAKHLMPVLIIGAPELNPVLGPDSVSTVFAPDHSLPAADAYSSDADNRVTVRDRFAVRYYPAGQPHAPHESSLADNHQLLQPVGN